MSKWVVLFFELRGRNVTMFQVKIPQISIIRQLIYDVAKSFTIWIFAQYWDFFRSLRRVSDTPGSNVADGSRQTGGPFLLRNGVGILRSAADSRLPSLINSPWCRLYQSFIIFIFRNTGTIWANKRFIIIISIKFWCMSWKSWLFICQWKSHVSSREGTRKTRQVQNNMSHCRVFSWRKSTSRKQDM